MSDEKQKDYEFTVNLTLRVKVGATNVEEGREVVHDIVSLLDVSAAIENAGHGERSLETRLDAENPVLVNRWLVPAVIEVKATNADEARRLAKEHLYDLAGTPDGEMLVALSTEGEPRPKEDGE
jgi:hypothetical protein